MCVRIAGYDPVVIKMPILRQETKKPLALLRTRLRKSIAARVPSCERGDRAPRSRRPADSCRRCLRVVAAIRFAMLSAAPGRSATALASLQHLSHEAAKIGPWAWRRESTAAFRLHARQTRRRSTRQATSSASALSSRCGRGRPVARAQAIYGRGCSRAPDDENSHFALPPLATR